MMWSFTICIVAFLVHLGAASFDCRRPSQSCAPSTTCSSTSGICDCSSAARKADGYDCRLISSKAGTGACLVSDPCSTNGTCYDDAGTALCYCTADTYGAICDEKRLVVGCEMNKMVIGVNPAGVPFIGRAYVQGYRTEQNCSLAPVPHPPVVSDSIPDKWKGYALELANTGSGCGDVAANNTGGNTGYTRKIVVQYQRDVVTLSDEFFSAQCVFDDSGALVYSGIITMLDVAALSN